MFRLVFLSTDICLYILLGLTIILGVVSYRRSHLRKIWKKVFQSKLAIASALMLVIFFSIALLDSIHFQIALPKTQNGQQYYSTKVYSLLDTVLYPLNVNYEKTYSAPFAKRSFVKTLTTKNNQVTTMQHQSLKYVKSINGYYLVAKVLIISLIVWLIIVVIYRSLISTQSKRFPHWFLQNAIFICIFVLGLFYEFSRYYHVFGTTKIGLDVFYETVKSIRTGVLIGTITTLFMVPLAIVFGISAGYFGGLIDDVIQYIYTTLSSIPGILLIAASVLSLQIFISNHPDVFKTVLQQADARLLALCLILGVTSWTGLCRLLRAETLKVREYDFVNAAKCLGTSNFKILFKHILPNVLHIIIISIVLDFSGLVLAEAVLSYVGVGVDPSMMSWGNMINSARLELARSPMVWWPLTAAFVFMFALVLSANVFSERVRDAFDPRNE